MSRRTATARRHGHDRCLGVAAVSSQRDMQRFFFRTILADGSAQLHCRTSLRSFDAAGRITTARPTPRRDYSVIRRIRDRLSRAYGVCASVNGA